MALNLKGYDLREAIGWAEAAHRLKGLPAGRDDVDWQDLTDIAAKWTPTDAYTVDDGRTCAPPSEAQVQAVIDAREAADAAVVAEAATDAANRTKAQAMLDALATITSDLSTFATQAAALSNVTLTGANLAALRNEVQGHLRQIGARLGGLIAGVQKLADGEEFTIRREVKRKA